MTPSLSMGDYNFATFILYCVSRNHSLGVAAIATEKLMPVDSCSGHPRTSAPTVRTERRRGSPGQAHGCPVEFLWTRGMALIPLGSGRFADDPDTRRGSMPCVIRIAFFHGLLKHLPWGEFDRLVAAHGADSRVRRLTTKDQLVALLYG